MKHSTSALFCLVLLLSGCKSAYYSAWEKLGWEKRDILVDRVEDARDAQEAAKEQFQTTLDRFQELTGFEGGALETKYRRLSSEYEQSRERAEAVRGRISSVESVAQDMFSEWRSELEQYENQELRRSSERQLNDARDRYDQLISIMRRSESKMQPVLSAFADQVLFLKHNLNAAAISSLQETATGIETDVQALIRDMEASIAEANEFISQLKT